ncbi:hypothetical protein [Nostoc sp.]|uniref:hypothetical protein n=1 Tax=Nostoc sp. TaxID=1180 RepID=UPI00359415D6
MVSKEMQREQNKAIASSEDKSRSDRFFLCISISSFGGFCFSPCNIQALRQFHP